ncbi:MAG: hypothetical protein E7351_00220 [Clostridiales bacterium]|nr:hypothetical protein [Clostridiales bacterium]
MARKERTVKNSIAAIFRYVVKLILQFVIRTMLIYKLGVEYVGLDSLYANIISMLSLAELGIGSAIVFSMYKPIAENDVEKLKSLNALYKKLYMIITIVVLVVGIALMPFIEFFISGEPNVNVNLYVVYVIFLANTVISYLGAHKRSLLFANQRNDIENNILTTQIIIMSIVQIAVLVIFKNYYLYAIMIPLFTLVEVIAVVIVANKLYPEINGKAKPLDKETKKTISKNIVATACHHLGSVVVMSTDNLLISKFFGLTMLGTISNYILIYNAINSLIQLFIGAVQASVGNMIATTDKEKVYKFYKLLNWFFACVTGFCSIALMCLYQPFMTIWVGDINALATIWVVLSIVVRFYVTQMRCVTNMFKTCAGLMWNDRFKPIIESVINIVASIICIQFFGVAGIFIGTIISTICAPLWVEPLVLYKNYFNKSLKEFFTQYIIFTIVTLIAGGLTYFVCTLLPTVGVLYFILKMAICIFVPLMIYLLFYFKTDYFKQCIVYAKNILKK